MAITKGRHVFPREEYLRRIVAVKTEMAQRNLEALIITDGSDTTYLTGYTAKTTPQGLLISVEREEPTFIVRKQDVPAALHQTFLQRDSVVAFPEELMGNIEKDGYDAVIDYILDAGLANRRIGLQLGVLSAHSSRKFKARLPQATMVDCTKVVSWIRMTKSDVEIDVMKEAAAITDAGIIRATEVIRPGVREADAMAEIVGALLRGANGKPGTWIANPYLCSSPRTGTSHIRWSEDVLRQGSQVNLEIAGVRHGYTAPICRTFSIGRPSDHLRRVHEAQLAGLEAGLDAIRPGCTCGGVAQEIYRAIKKLGVNKDSRCGYAVGIDWMELTASFREDDMTVMKPNMTFHLHLGNWIDEDFGYVISETVRVTETGVEVLTNTPRTLFEI